MKSFLPPLITVLSGLCLPYVATARGVTPYLPLNLAPEIERQIERVLILGDKPVFRRPIAAAIVLEALPKACLIDEELCRQVQGYLRRFMGDRGVTQLQGTAAITQGDSQRVMPNEHGMRVGDAWNVTSAAFYQFNDYFLANLGVNAYDGRVTPTGSVFSAGWSYAQLDIGYRDHWLSPLTDSSTLISTESATMPSITLSNYQPISKLGFSYEIFLAQMSEQHGIAYFESTTSGSPRISGLQTIIEPVSGYALGLNRIFQYGGGQRTAGYSQFIDAIFNNSNLPDTVGGESEFGNQVASITSSIVFPGAVPFAVRLEYAGDDNAYDSRRLGVTNMSVGLDFPVLWKRFDLSIELSEWQQGWYQHHIYPDGLTHNGIVIGHWLGDSRVFSDRVFGDSQSIALGVQLPSGYLRARYRTLANADYSPIPYERSNELSLRYSTVLYDRPVGAELQFGKDVFGESYARFAVSMDLIAAGEAVSHLSEASTDESVTEYFVDSGVNYSKAFERIAYTLPTVWTDLQVGYHVGVGARRRVSERSDLGVRLEFDDINQRSLISLRALDYRYRIKRHIAANGFFGFGRYEIFSLPAYGFYWGAGLQWIDILKGWDLSADYRMNDKLTRTKVLPTDPLQSIPGGIYVDTRGAALYVSKRF